MKTSTVHNTEVFVSLKEQNLITFETERPEGTESSDLIGIVFTDKTGPSTMQLTRDEAREIRDILHCFVATGRLDGADDLFKLKAFGPAATPVHENAVDLAVKAITSAEFASFDGIDEIFKSAGYREDQKRAYKEAKSGAFAACRIAVREALLGLKGEA